MALISTAAFFVENQCLFGSYPSDETVDILEKWGVDFFVDLTMPAEKKITPYETTRNVIRFPISDNSVPSNVPAFRNFIEMLCALIDNGKKIYIHCKGGHGRSGLVVASILCFKYKYDPETALKLTGVYHSTRKKHSLHFERNDFRKKQSSPRTFEQKEFVKNLYFTK